MALKPIQTQQQPTFLDDEQTTEYGVADPLENPEGDCLNCGATWQDATPGDVCPVCATVKPGATKEQFQIMSNLGGELQRKFNDVERKRTYIEDRWLEDLRQYHGRYDPQTEKEIKEAEGCQLFLNITRTKTNAFAARMMDMILPTDEKNWGLEQLPVPEIAGLDTGLEGEPAMEGDLQGAKAQMENAPGGAPGPGAAQEGALNDPNAVPGSVQPGPAVPGAGAPPPGAMAPGTAQAQAGGGTPGAQPPMPSTPDVSYAAQALGPEDTADQVMTTPEGNVILKSDLVQAVLDEAKARCKRMEDEIDDQLEEASWNSIQRQTIEQMSKLGAGIVMGPVVLDEWRTTWKPQPNPITQKTDFVRTLIPNDDKRPSAQWVDCWNFYPDMTSADPKEWEFAFVQYLVNASTLRKFAKRFNFDDETVKDVLAGGMHFNVSSMRWVVELRNMGDTNTVPDNRYRLLRYDGEITAEEAEAAGLDLEAMGLGDRETINVVAWLIDNKVLKVGLNPLDSGELPYSICYCDKDEQSPFGRGIPRLMRGEQDSVNAAWRMKHDNAGLSVCPMTVMRANAVSPADGDYNMKPKKLWYVADDVQNVANVFAQFSIDSHQAELDNILQMGIRFADDVTQMPMFLQPGLTPAAVTQTAQGMSLLYNASTVVLRRAVKLYDDYLTSPTIDRFYEWNMQFNPREDIKGDYRGHANGSSTLLDKEQRARDLDTMMQIAMQPVWQPYTDMEKLYREALKAKRVSDIILPPEKIKQNLAQQQALAMAQAQAGVRPPQPPDPLGGQKLQLQEKDLEVRQAEIGARSQDVQETNASKERVAEMHTDAVVARANISADASAKKTNAQTAATLRSNAPF